MTRHIPNLGKRKQTLVKSKVDSSESHFDAISPLEPTTPRMMVHVDPNGHATLVRANRLELAGRMEVSQRDLRLTDPWVPMPYPTSVLIRKKAILINLESIRMVVSRSECLVLSVGRITEEFVYTEEPTVDDPFIQRLCTAVRHGGPLHLSTEAFHGGTDYNLPFELRALEAGLSEACRLLEVEVTGAINEALDKLTTYRSNNMMKRSCIEDLKVVRGVITKLVSRVGKLKTQLEEILDDDRDMLDMHLAHQETPAWTRRTSTTHTATAPTPRAEPPPHAPADKIPSGSPVFTPRREKLSEEHVNLSNVTERPSLEQALFENEADQAADAPRVSDRAFNVRQSFIHGRHGFLTSSSSMRQRSLAPAGDDNGPNASFLVERPLTADGAERRDSHTPLAASSADFQRPPSPVPLTSVQMPDIPGADSSLPGEGVRDPREAIQAVSAKLERLLEGPSCLDELMHRLSIGKAEPGAEDPAAPIADLMDLPDKSGSGSGGGERPTTASNRWRSLLLDNLQQLKDQARRQEHAETQYVRPQDIQDVEAMLEAYFVQADFFLIKLQEITLTMDDFQNSVNYELNRRRNELFAIQLIITIVSAAFGFVAMIGGIFGMNLDNTQGLQQEPGLFNEVTIWSCVSAGLATILLLGYLRWKKMLFLGT